MATVLDDARSRHREEIANEGMTQGEITDAINDVVRADKVLAEEFTALRRKLGELHDKAKDEDMKDAFGQAHDGLDNLIHLIETAANKKSGDLQDAGVEW